MSSIEQTSAIEIKETRFSLSETGKGEPILFLHGNPGSRKDFSALIEKKSDNRFKFIIPDRPGHMASDEIINDENDPWVDAEYYAELIDRKCNGKALIVGYSMGCFIACRIALKYPDKVKGIVMLAPYLTPDNLNEKPSSIPSLSRGAFLGTVLGIVLPLAAQGKMQKHLENVFYPAQLSEEYLETWLPRYTRFESLLAVMVDKNAMLETLKEVHDGIPSLKCPVYAVLGAKDRVCSVENQKKLIQTGLPSASIIELPEAGHALINTDAEQCLKTIYEAAG